MAIPDNYIDKITKDGESRMISPAADKVRVDSEHYEGDNLDDVLDEIAEAIDEAGSGDGTVKGVKVGSTTYEPDGETGVVDLSTPIADKADKVPGKGLSTNDYTDADQAKLQALPTADGLTQQLSSKANASDVPGIIEGNVRVEQPVNPNGTFTIHVGDNDYTINLNHTHENMAKLVVCEESDLPSTLDNSTIYAITDSGETEIEKLIIRGMEFAGGGVPSTEPKIVSPIGTQIDFNGASTKTVTVRATNLSEALTIAVTGITANLQTISANDAANGVQLTLTKGQNFASGTLRIYSSEVDKSWNAFDSQGYQPLTAVKLTGTQWLKTPYKPNAATTVTMICRFEENEHTIVNDQTNHGYYFMGCVQNSSSERFLFYAFKRSANNYQLIAIVPSTPIKDIQYITGFLTDRSEFKVSPQLMSFTPNGGTAQTVAIGVTPTMLKELEIGRGITDTFGAQIFNYYDLTIYELTIIEGSTTVHHYLPKSMNGVPGLYDTVTNTFISSETSTELVAIPLT